MQRGIRHFATATLLPLPALAAGAVIDARWGLGALAALTLGVAGLDAVMPRDRAQGAGTAADGALLTILALMPLPLLALAACAAGLPVAGGAPARAGALAAIGVWLGTTGSAAALALLHARAPGARAVGRFALRLLALGPLAVTDPAVHHRFAATSRDPTTARRGESLYAYLPRAWGGAFRLARHGARTRRRAAGHGGGRATGPVLADLALVACPPALGVALGGPAAGAAICAVVGLALLLTLTRAYVQHYGLRREPRPDGRMAPLAAWHAWNAPHWASGLMLLNATRHSDLHAHPGAPFTTLRDSAPVLPRGPYVMIALAFLPPVWHRVMARRLPSEETG